MGLNQEPKSVSYKSMSIYIIKYISHIYFFLQPAVGPSGAISKVHKSDRKIGHRRVGEGGEITYKKIQSSQIMGSIQLGECKVWLG